MYCYQSNLPKAPVSSFGFGTSRISPEPRDKDIGLVGEERRTLTSKSYLHSFCCVTIWFVVPTNQLLAASVSICWRGRYGWKNASWENILSAVHGIWWGGALALLTPMGGKEKDIRKPMNLNKLVLSLVLKDVGLILLLFCSNWGDPESRRFKRSPVNFAKWG